MSFFYPSISQSLTKSSFGLIATEKGFNIFVAGNGGATPRHSELLAKDVPPDDIIPILDRYLMFYIRTADKLQRTARWLEALPGGIAYLRSVILEDKLGICASLESQMQELVGTFFDEWKSAIEDPKLKAKFAQFSNTEETVQNMELENDRGQVRPVYWAPESARTDFKNVKWTNLQWERVLDAKHFEGADEMPNGISATIKRGDTQLAVFRVKGRWLASQQMCPHKRAFVLSDGLIGDDGDALWVSCPLHKRNFDLGEGKGRCQNDGEVSIATFGIEERDGGVWVKLPPVDELDGVLGTKRWIVKKGESGEAPFAKLDRKLGMKGRKPDPGLAARREITAGEGIDW